MRAGSLPARRGLNAWDISAGSTLFRKIPRALRVALRYKTYWHVQ